uniref:WD repeat-containing protein 55 homolog n=2 Tax=Rhodnius prolixus TaxID=13249 RepID=T1HIB0_RHOPR
MKLVDDLVRTFRVAKVFRENTDAVRWMNFSPNGERLISCYHDDQIELYNCETGTVMKTLQSKKYGVDLVNFSRDNTTAIHGSTKVDNSIRYLSLLDNKYIRYYAGHTKRVVSLGISPTDDSFISGSLDRSLRFWDLRTPSCHGQLQLTGKPLVAYSPEGLVLAVGLNNEGIQLYDIRSIDKGPFITFQQFVTKEDDWTALKFSSNGRTLLISSTSAYIRLVDAFHGTPLQTFTGHLNNHSTPVEASFSPDSQFVLSGSSDGRVHVWNARTGYKVCVFNAGHTGPVYCVQFNPKFMMFASACTNMSFWLPLIQDF